MLDFLAGANTALFLVATLVFLRLRSKTREPLFTSFAVGFVLMALHQWVYFLLPAHEHGSLVYLIRVAAYVLILAAILAKNVSANRAG